MSEPTVTGPEAMIQTIKRLGIVPFFENHIPGYSIEEFTPQEHWFDSDEKDGLGPWDWKIDCVQSGEIAYGKFLCGGKAAFATVPFYRELRNYRLSVAKYAPDETQQKILDYVAEHGAVTIREVRALLGIKKSAADALITRLQMGCRLVTGDLQRVYRGENLTYKGWQVASFCRPEDLFDDASDFPFAAVVSPTLKTTHTPQESLSLLADHISALTGATPASALKVLR